MENLIQVFVIAILAESVWENLKMAWQAGKFNINNLGALIVSILICLATRIDVFSMLSIEITIPFVGSFLTGILVSRGANVLHDVVKKIQALNS